MRKNKKQLIFICAICLVALILAVVAILLLTKQKDSAKTPSSEKSANSATNQTDNQETEPASGNTNPGNTNPGNTNPGNTNPGNTDPGNTDPGNTDSGNTDPNQPEDKPQVPDVDQEDPVQPPVDVPPVVEIPDEDEVVGLQFPCEVPNHSLRIEKLEPYSGMFVEDGTNRQVTDVAMLLVYNHGTTAVEYTEITVEYQGKTLTFQITALPAGQKMVVQEKSGAAIPAGVPLSASALVVHRAQMQIAQGLSVVDNGDNSLTIKNLSGETVPTVRVFYKYYMADENLYVGGIAFTVRVTNLAPGGSVVVRPSHYNSQTYS